MNAVTGTVIIVLVVVAVLSWLAVGWSIRLRRIWKRRAEKREEEHEVELCPNTATEEGEGDSGINLDARPSCWGEHKTRSIICQGTCRFKAGCQEATLPCFGEYDAHAACCLSCCFSAECGAIAPSTYGADSTEREGIPECYTRFGRGPNCRRRRCRFFQACEVRSLELPACYGEYDAFTACTLTTCGSRVKCAELAQALHPTGTSGAGIVPPGSTGRSAAAAIESGSTQVEEERAMEKESVPECFEEFRRVISHACEIRSESIDDDVGSRLRAAAARTQNCYGQFDKQSISYHEEQCLVCNRVRVCLHQEGIRHVRIGSAIVTAKPIEAPDCYADWDNQVHRSREIDCEDTCRRYFIDCIRDTHSAMRFADEIGQTRASESEKETQPEEPDEPTSRFDIIDIDEGEDE